MCKKMQMIMEWQRTLRSYAIGNLQIVSIIRAELCNPSLRELRYRNLWAPIVMDICAQNLHTYVMTILNLEEKHRNEKGYFLNDSLFLQYPALFVYRNLFEGCFLMQPFYINIHINVKQTEIIQMALFQVKNFNLNEKLVTATI